MAKSDVSQLKHNGLLLLPVQEKESPWEGKLESSGQDMLKILVLLKQRVW